MKNFKMLYLSCHSIHEYEEVKLFTELGIDVFSHGAYLDPNKPDDPMRPGFPGRKDEKMIELAKIHPKEKLTKEMIDPYDVIVVMHVPKWIIYNWELFKNKTVIWRCNGQSCQNDENSLKHMRKEGLKIVRWSPMERTIPDYLGEDAVIRFGLDPDEWKGWNGAIPQVVTVGQSMVKRRQFCGWDTFLEATKGFRRKLYGPHNEDAGKLNGGFLPIKALKQVYQNNRVYFYTGTFPAPYTLNFIEAFMTGIPIVAIGPIRGNPPYLPGQQTYEIHNIIEQGAEGFVSDNIEQLQYMVRLLMERKDVAKYISENARKRAISLFGKEKIKEQWRKFFEGL